MDIHRLRSVPFPPQSINALAFSHTSNPQNSTPQDLRLAVGREGGSIEIWGAQKGNWYQERIFPGGVGRTIEQVGWSQSLEVDDGDDTISEQPSKKKVKINHGPLRLFSSGGSSAITEWDLVTGMPKSNVDGNSADIWCFAVQPQWSERQINDTKSHSKNATSRDKIQAEPSQKIAAGCADGSIILFNTSDNELRYDRVLAPPPDKKSRVVSICWRNRNTVVAGYEESLIRVIDVPGRQVLRNMYMRGGSRKNQLLVWCVRALVDGTIVSGNSAGEVQIWDKNNFSLLQTIKSHEADVLDITSNADCSILMTTGVDRRTVTYGLHTMQDKRKQWVELRHRRYHDHDVKCIAAYESSDISCAVSGGIDAVPIVVPMKGFAQEVHRSLPHLPHKSCVSGSGRARLMLAWWDNLLSIYQLPNKYQELNDNDSVSEDEPRHQLLGHIQLRGDENITSAHISRDGSMIIAATSSAVKLFQIRRSTGEDGQVSIRSRSITLPTTVANQGASMVGFSPDQKWLFAVRLNNVVALAKIAASATGKSLPQIVSQIVKLDRSKKQSRSRGSLLSTYQTVPTSISFSHDSRILAVGDLSGAIYTWTLQGRELAAPDVLPNGSLDAEKSDSDSDSSDEDDETLSPTISGQKWIKTPAGHRLPNLGAAISCLSFKPAIRDAQTPAGARINSSRLVAITSTNQIVEFDTLNCRLTDWSRRNPVALYPSVFKDSKDRIMGVWWDCRTDEHGNVLKRLWLYGSNSIFMIDMNRDFALPKQETEPSRILGKLGDHDVEAPVSQQPANQGQGKKRKRNGGAGDEMKKGRKQDATVKKVQIPQDGMLSPISMKQQDDINIDIDIDIDMLNVEDNEQGQIALARRQESLNEDDNQGKRGVAKQSKPFFRTFQYRSILGAFALEQESDQQQQEEGRRSEPPEVVIVERPMYDVELPPRFSSGQDW